MAILILISGILLLILLITLLKLNAYISLLIAALYVGIFNKMPLQKIISSISTGVGTTLGSLVLVIGFGVILGSLLTETGATQRISSGLIKIFGIKRVKLAMVITGFAVGIAMFYNAGFVVLIPVAFSVAAATATPLVYICVAMASALSVTHGFLPPHPGPTAIAVIFKADIGKTLFYGFIVAIPAIFCSGILFPEFLKKIKTNPPPGMFQAKTFAESELPGFGISLFTALVPVILMGLSTATSFIFTEKNTITDILLFVGDPSIALLITVLIALVLLGTMRGMKVKDLMDKSSSAISSIAVIILIIGGGGAFKQILIDSGTGAVIADYFKTVSLSPLVLGWVIATIIRVSLGSATVAALTAAGIVQPILATSNVNPELMVLSIGAGSLMFSHVNDTGFWMFKEYLGLSLADTFRTWTLMETIVGVSGLGGVLLLNQFI